MKSGLIFINSDLNPSLGYLFLYSRCHIILLPIAAPHSTLRSISCQRDSTILSFLQRYVPVSEHLPLGTTYLNRPLIFLLNQTFMRPTKELQNFSFRSQYHSSSWSQKFLLLLFLFLVPGQAKNRDLHL